MLVTRNLDLLMQEFSSSSRGRRMRAPPSSGGIELLQGCMVSARADCSGSEEKDQISAAARIVYSIVSNIE